MDGYGPGQAALDGVAKLDWIDRAEGLISSFVDADWQGAYKGRGGAGALGELVATELGRKWVVIRIDRAYVYAVAWPVRARREADVLESALSPIA